MTNFQKVISIGFIMISISLSYFLISQSKKDYTVQNIAEPKTENQKNIEIPNEYHIRIVHAGGEGIRTRTTEIVGVGDGYDYYLNEPEYKKEERAPSSMNNGGNLIRLSCREGYKIKDCRSDSNEKTTIDNSFGCGITVDKMKIFGRLECIK